MIVVFTVSKYLTDLRNLKNIYTSISISMFLCCLPALLVFKQPDLGTAFLIGIGGTIVIWPGIAEEQ